jgi:23S rRNA (guanine745-N1)-methyltransferase
MLAARRRVHQANAYLPLANALVDQLAELETGGVILDIGCGEGYYCGAMASAIPASKLYGIDISRAAVRLAAKGQRAASFAVASAFQLPVVDACVDVVVRVFAPSDDDEVARVLKSGQYYLEVTPALGHLGQLRERLYTRAREHAPAREQIAGMCLLQQRRLDYPLALSPELLADIISMTPFAHRGHREKREDLLKSGLDCVNMAFTLSLFQLER